MCRTCGCSDDSRPTLTDMQTGQSSPVELDHVRHGLDSMHAPPGDGSLDHLHFHHHHDHSHEHVHSHDHDHEHHHSHDHDHQHAHDGLGEHHHVHPVTDKVIRLEQELLAKNRFLAERNRGWLDGRNILALNLVSAPGAGKTTILERTIRDLKDEIPISVIEGDQATLQDAERIRAAGCNVMQINTGTGCHLEAAMTAQTLQRLNPPHHSLVLIENVGNLVCPALFDLGERAKVVIMSVTDGHDKPLKYPHIFRASNLMIINKIDLLPYVNFNVDQCLHFARQVNRNLQVLQVSATRGDGLSQWYDWLRQQRSTERRLIYVGDETQ